MRTHGGVHTCAGLNVKKGPETKISVLKFSETACANALGRRCATNASAGKQ